MGVTPILAHPGSKVLDCRRTRETAPTKDGATLWDIATGKKLHTFQLQYTWITDRRLGSILVLSPDGKLVLTSGGEPILWEAATGKEVRRLDIRATAISAVGFSPDSKQLLTGTYYGELLLWDVASGKKIRTIEGPIGHVSNIAYTRDGRVFFTASDDGSIRLWNSATISEICALYNFNAARDWLVFTPDGYFDGSEGGMKLMAWREAGTINRIEDDETRKRMHRPGLLATLYKGEKVKP